MRAELAELVRCGTHGDPARYELLEGLLEDSTIPAAVFHSRALDRDFVFARDEESAESYADRQLPVLYFSEASRMGALGLDGIRALLDFRAEFGPQVRLSAMATRSVS